MSESELVIIYDYFTQTQNSTLLGLSGCQTYFAVDVNQTYYASNSMSYTNHSLPLFYLIAGTDIQRTCANDLGLDDCAFANEILYCYCTGDLCNRVKAKVLRQDQKRRDAEKLKNEKHLRTPATTDDEDLEESSGLGELQRPVLQQQQTKKQLSTPTDHHLQQSASQDNNNNKKNYMVTLRPSTEALNLTTSSPSSATPTSAVALMTMMVMILFPTMLQRLNFHYDSSVVI